MMSEEKDRGYSWIVMLAVYWSHLVYGTCTFGFVSVLTYIWVEHFQISPDTAAWAPSIMSGTLFITGPIVSLMIKTTDCWKMQLVGVILSIIGSLCAAFATGFWQILTSFGLLQAFGYAMTQLATYDIVAMYFDKHKDKVYAALFSFYCAGLLVGPILIEFFIKTLGYTYAMLLAAGFNMLNLPTAFIYRGLSCCCGINHNNHPDAKPVDTISEKIDSDAMDGDEDSSECSVSLPINEHSDVYPSSLDDVNASTDSTSSKMSSILSSHKLVLKQPAFILVLVHSFVCSAGDNSFYSLAVDYVVRKGLLNLEEAAVGMTLCGVSAMVGSLVLAALSHWSINRLTLTTVTAGIMGTAIVLVPCIVNKTGIFCVMVIFGFADSIYAANIISLVTQLFAGDDLMIIRFSYVLFTIGLGSLAGPVTASHLSLKAGIDSMMYLTGSFSLTSTVLILPYWLYNICKKSR